eukprot:gene19627-25537_t
MVAEDLKKYHDLLIDVKLSINNSFHNVGLSMNKNKYDHLSNPNGIICLSFVKQSDVVHKFTSQLWKSSEKIIANFDCDYQYSWGNRDVRQLSAKFWNDFISIKTKKYSMISSDNLLLTNGSNHSLLALLHCLRSSNSDSTMNEVILSSPYYSNHIKLVKQSQCTSVIVPEDNFNPHYIDKHLDVSNILAIVVTSPSNPSGHVLASYEVIEWVKWATSHTHIAVIFDETMLCTAVSTTSSLFNHLIDFSLVINNIYWVSSLSKFGLESWRVGFVYCPNTKLLENLYNYLSLCPVSFLTQRLVSILFKSLDKLQLVEWIEVLFTNTKRSIDNACELLESLDMCHDEPSAGLYVSIDFSSVCKSFSEENSLYEAILHSSSNGVLLLRGFECGYKDPDSSLMLTAIRSIHRSVVQWHSQVNSVPSHLSTVSMRCSYWEKVLYSCWKFTDNQVFSYLTDELWYSKPIAYRHPFIFYLGHMSSFASNLVKRFYPNNFIEINELFDLVFERGIDPDVNNNNCKHRHSWMNELNWTDLNINDITNYRDKVRGMLIDILNDLLISDRGETLLHVMLEHEYMHQETLQYMLIQIPVVQLNIRESNQEIKINKIQTPNDWLFIPGSDNVKIGRNYNDEGFGWDNEFGGHVEIVKDLYVQCNVITNKDFLAFVKSDGYSRVDYWDEESFQFFLDKPKHPILWIERDDGSFDVRVNVEHQLEWSEAEDYPVVVSWVEASAYCKWLSIYMRCDFKLPSEAEWIHSIRNTLQSNHKYWTGDYWEWTNSIFKGHNNYDVNKSKSSIYSTELMYSEYSVDFWDNQHYVMLGKSHATTDHIMGSKFFNQRITFRNWFQKLYRYMFTSFRCFSYTDPSLVLKNKTDVNASVDEVPIDKALIWRGLKQPTGHKHVPSYMFYDDIGSQIFSEIMHLPEYYLCRAEESLLKLHSIDIIVAIMSEISHKLVKFVELGCGDGLKSLQWLEKVKIENSLYSYNYIPTDISSKAIELLLDNSKKWPDEIRLRTKPLLGSHELIFDYYLNDKMKFTEVKYNKVYLFLGSSLGNYTVDQSKEFLMNLSKSMNDSDVLWLGFDLVKTPKRLVAAYDDSQKVTERFNFNLIKRLNELFDWNLTEDSFEHLAFYNPKTACMESWLINKEKVVLTYDNDSVEIKEWEGIHTEISMKYRVDDIDNMLRDISYSVGIGSYELLGTWYDENDDFCHAVWRYHN